MKMTSTLKSTKKPAKGVETFKRIGRAVNGEMIGKNR